MSNFLWIFRWCALLCLACAAWANIDEASLLRADQAFKVSVQQLDDHRFSARFEIADGYYLYRERFKFALKPAVGEISADLPPGKKKHDEYFGEVETYRHQLEVPLTTSVPFAKGSTIQITSQGCADAGLCYPPQTVAITPQAGQSNAGVAALFKSDAPAPTSQNAAEAALRQGNPLWIAALFFVVGLGLSFTACMYPLIPIVSGIVVGQGAATSKMRSAALSFVYVQGMAITYAIAGVVAALSGSLLANALQQPAVLIGFALFFVVMALSMFGLFSLQLPSGLQSRLNNWSNRLPGGRWLPVFAMGILSALIIGPCVAPPLAAALGYIGSSGNVVLGGLALYAMALGIGAPLIVVGLAGGHVLPRAGPWMQSVRNVFGAVMLALALWIAHPALPDWLFMLGLAALLLGAGIHLSALDPLPTHPHRWQRLWKALGVGLLVVGIAQLVGVLAGQRDPLQPLQGLFASQAAATSSKLPFQPVRSVAELDKLIAANKGKWLMLDFYADWCVSCKEMERFTFSDAMVRQQLANVVLLKADVTANLAEDQALLARFKLFGPPGIVFFTPDGRELPERLIGFESAPLFVERLRRTLAAQP